MSRTRMRLLVAGFVLSVIAIGAVWAFHAYEDARKVGRAKNDMRTLEKAYGTYFTQYGKWPEKLECVTSWLERGNPTYPDPWGGRYVVQIEDVTQPDGKVIERPIVYCQPPGDRPRLQWPEK